VIRRVYLVRKSTIAKRRISRSSAQQTDTKENARVSAWPWAIGFGAVLLCYLLYAPAFHGPFVFDDASLPFNRTMRVEALPGWTSGVRPVLMASYWLNFRLGGDDPTSYHALNALIHAINTLLVFLVLRRLLLWAGWTKPLAARMAAFGCLIFLVHPLQTESVSYVAGRSESLSALFQLAAYAIFLYRRKESISWLESLAVLGLFLLAIRTKENAVSLFGILILTDLIWPVPFTAAGLRRNWKLYSLMLPGALISTIFVLRMLATAPSAGFGLQSANWLQYFFTEARAIFTYIRLAIVPAGLSIDHDFPVSHTVFEHGAIFWILLLMAMVFAGWRVRHKYPLAFFGLFFFLLGLAPTSSIIPVADSLVDRRMYLPILGLVLIAIQVCRSVQIPSRVGWYLAVALVLVLSAACYRRNVEWGQPEQLFAAAADQSTHNFRPYLHLTEVLVHEHNCGPAVPYLQRADRLFPNSFDVAVAWGWALECMGRPNDAMQKLQKAASLNPRSSLIYEWIGLLYGEMQKPVEAGDALRHAVELDPNSVRAHEALGLWYRGMGDLAAAEQEYAKSLSIDPRDPNALAAIDEVRAQRTDGGTRPGQN
jgi:protein O-mannosyl-transferase